MNTKKIFIPISLVAILCSCSNTKFYDWSKHKNNSIAFTLKSSKYSSYDLSFDFDKFLSLQDAASASLKAKEPASSLKKITDELFAMQNRLNLLSEFYYTNYSGNSTGEGVYEKYEKSNVALMNFSTWYYQFLIDASKSSQDVKSLYFGSMSDEQIQEYLNSMKSSDKMVELNTIIAIAGAEGQQIINDYSAKLITQDEYFDQMLSKLVIISDAEHQLEDEIGCEDYINYQYKNSFHRDYTRDKVEYFADYLKTYDIPFVENYVNPISLSSLSADDVNWVTTVSNMNFCNENAYLADAINEHVSRMGGNFLSYYNHLWNDGYYYFSSNDDCVGTAFSTFRNNKLGDSICFFGKKHQTAMTINHEFGHYFALNSNPSNAALSYDALEIHSQGNENLFLNSLVEHYKTTSRKNAVYYYANDYYIYRLKKLIDFVSVALVENYVFDNYQLPFETLKQGVKDIISSLGKTASPVYWAYGSVCSPLYYISYGTSLITSIEIGCQGYKDFDTAKTNYFNLVNFSGSSSEFTSSLKNWNLHSAFDQSAYQFIFENLPQYK